MERTIYTSIKIKKNDKDKLIVTRQEKKITSKCFQNNLNLFSRNNSVIYRQKFTFN